jgi:hypothetical protein
MLYKPEDDQSALLLKLAMVNIVLEVFRCKGTEKPISQLETYLDFLNTQYSTYKITIQSALFLIAHMRAGSRGARTRTPSSSSRKTSLRTNTWGS